MEPTVVLVAGALKAAADAGAAEIGKKAGSVVADHAKGLLVRLHMVRRRIDASENAIENAPENASGTGDETAEPWLVELDPARAEEYAVAIVRRAAEDPETARMMEDLLTEARGAGYIPQTQPSAPPAVMPPRVFVNRIGEQADLADAVAAGVVVVAGRSGIGKTSLVLKWLADLAAAKAFQVCVHLDLHDRGREVGVGEIARELLERVGADTSVSRPAADWVARWHAVMRGTRYCVVLDEVTQPGQVRALIPEQAGSLLVAVGVEPLGELAGDGAEFVEVGAFEPDAGVELVRRLIGGARADAEPEAVEQVVAACDGIPAVLALAAGILRQKREWPVAQLAGLLADGERQLDVLRKRGGGRHVVDLVFDAGYAELDPDEARVYRAIGHLEREDFQAGVLAALADLPESATVGALETLLAKFMVQERVRPQVGYRVGDMQRHHAREAAQRSGEFGVQARTAAAARVRDLLVETVQEADAASVSGKPLRVPETVAAGGRFATAAEALEWIDVHLADLLACAETGDDDAVLRIAASMWPYATNYRRWDDGAWLYRRAAEVARRTGFAEAEARNLCELSRCLLETYDKDGARAAVTRAAEIVHDAPVRLRASVMEFAGLVKLADGRYQEAYEDFVACGDLHRTTRDADGAVRRGEVLAMEMQGRALRWAGEFDRAVTLLKDALRVAPEEQRLQARLRMDLAEALLNAERGGEAVPYLEEALPLLAAQRMEGDIFNAEVMLRAARSRR